MSRNDTEDRVVLGRRLRECRERRGWTQHEVATELGIHRPALTLIEAGKQGIDVLLLVKLAGFYGTTTGRLLGEEPITPTPGMRKLMEMAKDLPDGDQDEIAEFLEFLNYRRVLRSGGPGKGGSRNG
jgi:transcriptional regulator with XRE-family HTH domain